MILANLKTALQNSGVVEIHVEKGDEYDGNLHQAFEEEETDEVKPGHVLKVKQKGYTIHDRLLRPAVVVIAGKGEE